jgi:hypothetical protein
MSANDLADYHVALPPPYRRFNGFIDYLLFGEMPIKPVEAIRITQFDAFAKTGPHTVAAGYNVTIEPDGGQLDVRPTKVQIMNHGGIKKADAAVVPNEDWFPAGKAFQQDIPIIDQRPLQHDPMEADALKALGERIGDVGIDA